MLYFYVQYYRNFTNILIICNKQTLYGKMHYNRTGKKKRYRLKECFKREEGDKL